MLKYFLDDYTRKKIYFARSLHEIEKYINKDNIPKAMVGDHLFPFFVRVDDIPVLFV
jgi:hypothetical protein